MEVVESRASIFGRLADYFNREVLNKKVFEVEIQKHSKKAIYKDDGYFVFSDIQPSVSNYKFAIKGKLYDSRELEKSIAADTTEELSFSGEDELYVYVTNVNPGQDQVTFKKVSFIPTIEKGSKVYGETGFESVLVDDLEGSDKTIVLLEDVTGLSQHTVLRIIRSNNLMLTPSPYYNFPKNTTITSLIIKEQGVNPVPLNDVNIEIVQVNDNPVVSTNISGLDVKTAQLNGAPTNRVILGTNKDINRVSNNKGAALFFFEKNTPITKLHLKLKKSGYQDVTHEVAITQGERRFEELLIAPV